jgi:hypothetical protein
MSRWLKSVNTLLDSLDGTAENVVEDGIPTSKGAIGQILSRRGMEYDDDEEDEFGEEDFEEEEAYYEEEEVEEEATEEEEEEVLDFEPSEQPHLIHKPETSASQEVFAMPHSASPPLRPPPIESASIVTSQAPSKAVEEQEHTLSNQPHNPQQSSSKQVVPHPSAGVTEESSGDETAVLVDKPSDGDSSEAEPSTPPRPTTSPPRSANITSPPVSGRSTGENIQQQLKKYKLELKKSQAEARQLRKHVMQLNQELESSEAEVKAQQEELQRAAERMEKDRQRANEEREDLLDEQEEELETQKSHYEKELKDQKVRYEEQIGELQERLSSVEEMRMKEGGDWTKELEDSVQREREAIRKLSSLKDENVALKSAVAKLESQHAALQGKLESSAMANQTAVDRERQAEDKLDAALSLHSRQLSQRQAREAELERMIADLGAALARSRQKEKSPVSVNNPGSSYKEQFESAIDELETARAQLVLEMERCDALRNELTEISKERTDTLAQAQAQQRQHDREITDLKSTISRLEASLRERKKVPMVVSGETDAVDLYQRLEESKKNVATLSEQLIQQQAVSQNSKQEVLALKNRLQSATARAESAENALLTASSSRNAYEVDSGGVEYGGASMRRRVKGGRTKGNSNVRSIRSALGLHPGRVGPGMEQVVATIDAVDSWLVDTGSFMKNEPVARLGLILYLCILHMWSFCLVIFHASSYEEVHGDFGSMNDPGGHGPNVAKLLRHSHGA